jgi:hypothetical protein
MRRDSKLMARGTAAAPPAVADHQRLQMANIARLATVSRALNGSPLISNETRDLTSTSPRVRTSPISAPDRSGRAAATADTASSIDENPLARADESRTLDPT